MRRILSVMAAAWSGLAAVGVVGAARPQLVIRDNIGRAWQNEPIAWKLSLPPRAWDGKTFRVLRDGKAVLAQAEVRDRHKDGSVRTATVVFVVDKLAADAATTITFEAGKAGPKQTTLRVTREKGAVVLSSALTAVRLIDRGKGRAGGNLAPILGVRLPSGKWTGGGHYDCKAAKPVGSRTELLERGPVRLVARVTTTFDNKRKHVVTVTLWAGARSIELDEVFDVGPDDKYSFKKYTNDRDELAWEWWQWYGQKDGTKETHPNYFVFSLSGEAFTATRARHGGEHSSTDADKKDRPGGYALTYSRPSYLEKYLVGHSQWRPDGVAWYLAAAGNQAGADVVGLYARSVRRWRNPNVFPLPKGITLRTGANDMRIVSKAKGKALEVYCPIGLGRRTWAIRPSTWRESHLPQGASKDALQAAIVRQSMGLDITRKWITDWKMDNRYPRLFIKPQQKQAYYAKLKGKGIGSPGNVLDTFLRRQDQAGFQKDYDLITKQADRMVRGYISTGMNNVGYPGWMLGYWHGIIVANGADNLLGSSFCTPRQARQLKKKLAILTYCLVSKDAWPDKQINYGWGSMNMPVGRWGGLVVMASALSDHPMAKTWLKDAGRYFKMVLETEYAPDGVGVSCPHYIGASSTTFYSWFIMANSGIGMDVTKSKRLQKFFRYYMHLMKPIDPRWGIRVLINEGDTRPGSSPMFGIYGTMMRNANPDLAGQLMAMWRAGGSDLSQGMGVPDAVIIDESIPSRPITLKSAHYPGFGAFLHGRKFNTPEERYLAMMGGNFMIDHANTDQLSFAWTDKGVPLSVFTGSLYQPMTCTALSHNTIAWNVRPGGKPDPGKGAKGNWYHDNDQPFVNLGGKRPTLHYQIGWSKDVEGTINDTRGMITRAVESAGADLLEGKVRIKALTETPTRPDNYAIAIATQAWPPATKLAKPFTWTRRLLYVKAPTAAGMNYLVIRDDFGGYRDKTPHFNYWALADAVKTEGPRAFFKGHLGVDQDMVVLRPAKHKLHTGSFTHDQCEPIVGHIHRRKYKKRFTETTKLCRVEGRKDEGFLVVIFPYKTGEQRPGIESWAGGAGAKITWKGQTHYVLLDTKTHRVDADGVKAETSALVVKVTDANNASLTLPAGGKARFGKLSVQADGTNPAAARLVTGRAGKVPAASFIHK